MSVITLYPCPSCDKVAVSADDTMCDGCRTDLARSMALYSMWKDIETLNKIPMNTFTDQDKRLLQTIQSSIEGLVIRITK